MTMSEVEKNTDCSFDQVLRWPTNRSRDWTRTFVLSAKQDLNIIAIVAIGSAVRPNVSTTDLDLLTVCTVSNSLNASPPIEVDLRIYPLAGIEDKLGKGHDLLTWSIKFGRVLYQQLDYWDKLVGSWSYRLPLPSARLARERSVVVYRHLSEFLKLGDEHAALEQAISYFTHLVRAELLERAVYPASRPELAGQLRDVVGDSELADNLDRLLVSESVDLNEINKLFTRT
jgi:hypothetical protein